MEDTRGESGGVAESEGGGEVCGMQGATEGVVCGFGVDGCFGDRFRDAAAAADGRLVVETVRRRQ